jgi:hypothetical protein
VSPLIVPAPRETLPSHSTFALRSILGTLSSPRES